jgi:signal transduction histidine kinase
VNPAGLQFPYAEYILSAKLLLLLVVSVLCGLLLEQIRREQNETERERTLAQRLGALNDLFQHLSTSLDLDHTLQTVARAPQALLDAEGTSIALFDEGGEGLSIVATSGLDGEQAGAGLWPVDHGLVLETFRAGRPRLLDGSEPRPSVAGAPSRWPVADAAGRQDARRTMGSRVLVPLILDEKPLGLLTVTYSRPRQPSEEDLVFLQGLGQEAALAIRNARLYEREREQVARLEALDELQDAFVSAVSHELRTPLTCIKTSVDLLHATSGCLADEQGELVRTMEHHVARLEGLVADLLDVTRLEAGQVTLSTQPTDVTEIVRRVVNALHPLTARKDQTIELELPTSLVLVEADRRRIEQVLTNILSNAIKFTPKGGRIAISLLDRPDAVEVQVTDDGPGISESDAEHLFERFYTGAERRGLAGVGLGLYIARQMVELHGGRIWVESKPGQGSRFLFTLPRQAGGEESP